VRLTYGPTRQRWHGPWRTDPTGPHVGLPPRINSGVAAGLRSGIPGWADLIATAHLG
jgi:hypothetical protein